MGCDDCNCCGEIVRLELQFLALKEERARWRADNEWLSADNDRLRAALDETADALELIIKKYRRPSAPLAEKEE